MIKALSIALSILSVPSLTLAQVVLDTTLGANSSRQTFGLSINGTPSERIDGGLIRGDALFHSFRELNVEAGRGVYFTSPAGVNTIFSRVTGTTPSAINGALGILGQANFVFINPNGIQFGAGAKLDLRGSFLASTANSIRFQGGEFSATNPQASLPLLTVNTPIGLVFDGAAKPISVQGNGYNFSLSSPDAVIQGQRIPALRVDSGRTLALIGGSVNLTGGILSAPSGQVEIGGIDQGVVAVTPNIQGLQFDYAGVTRFAPVDFSRLSVVDAGGLFAGKINIQAQSLRIADGSYVTLFNQGFSPGGTIQATVQDQIDLIGTTDTPINRPTPFDSDYRAGLVTATAFGDGANIFVRAKKLTLDQGGGIQTLSYVTGKAGTIRVDVSEQINIKKSSPIEIFNAPSLIQSFLFNGGQTGNIIINTDQLNVVNGGGILTGPAAGSTGNGSDILINAKGTRVEGIATNRLTASIITAGSLGAGNAGNVSLNTNVLEVLDGGQVTSIASGDGDAGNVSIRASTINVQGRNPNLITPSAVGTSIVLVEPNARPFFNATGTPVGRGGTLTIQADSISLSDFGQLRVLNEGVGDGGSVQVQSNQLTLKSGASISAATQSGQGGNIGLNINRALRLNNSQISASSGVNGQGGNISINSGVFAALRQSSISANATVGRGGEITINSKGAFISPDSTLTATSALGPTFNGIVQVNTIESGVERTTLRQPIAPLPVAVQPICPTQSNSNTSQFIDNGTGGLPSNPSAPLANSSGWIPQPSKLSDRRLPLASTKPPVVEFQSWRFSRDRKTVELTAAPSAQATHFGASTCQPSSTTAKS